MKVTMNGVGGGHRRPRPPATRTGRVAVEEAVGDAVPTDLGDQAEEEDAGEAGDPVRGEHVEGLVDPRPRPPGDHRVAGQRPEEAEHHRPARG
jgi:hypothetical protein